MTTKDIQSLINARADKKLKENLKKISNLLYNGEGYQLLRDISVNIGTAEKPKNIGLAFILSDSGLESQIIEKNTERYREQEIEEFLAKVDSLREDVDTFLDSRSYD